MLKLAKDLEFISQINSDGSGTTPISKSYFEALNSQMRKNDLYELKCLSFSKVTFIAFGFNVFVVKLKERDKIK